MEHMPKLQDAMDILMDTFDKYAAVEGRKDTLTKAEAKTLLEKELSDFFQGVQSQDEVDKLLNELDANRDSEIDFLEFAVLVGSLAWTCYDMLIKK